MMHALRLHPGDELMSSLKQYCSDNNLRTAYVATCVGSLKAATLRLANADRDRPNEIKSYEQRFEVVSVVGTVSPAGAHARGGAHAASRRAQRRFGRFGSGVELHGGSRRHDAARRTAIAECSSCGISPGDRSTSASC